MLQVKCDIAKLSCLIADNKVKGTSKCKVEFWRGYNAINNNLNRTFTLDKQWFIANQNVWRSHVRENQYSKQKKQL